MYIIRNLLRYIIKSQRNTPSVMIYTLKRDDIRLAAMIYQVCDLDKKILQKMYHFLQYFLVTHPGICSALRGFRRGSGGAMLRPRFTRLRFSRNFYFNFRVSVFDSVDSKTKKDTRGVLFYFGDPSGNRTRVSSVRG